MKLPNADQAVVEIEKLVDYCLDPLHPRGRHKARVFRSACGFTDGNAELLRQQLLVAAELGEALPGKRDHHGQRFVIEYQLDGPTGRAWVRTAWIVAPDEAAPRFLTAYVM